MKHPERVEDYLAHIVEAIERATSYVQPLPDRAAFEQNQQVQDAVVRNIEIIGEAANQINRMAPAFIAQHPELPWDDMRDMRNIVIHAYFDVDLEIVWQTVHRGFAEAETTGRSFAGRAASRPVPRAHPRL
jgi:uncharacterized protein with HEPN domain